jgi:hypothetical protein
VDRAVPFQTVFPSVPRSIGHRSRIRGVWEMRSAWRLVAGASDVPTVWLRRLLRQVKEQARPRAFPPNWPSLDPALQRAGYGLGVVLCGRGPARPDMTEVLLPGLTSDRHELRPPNFSAAGNPTIHGTSTQDGPIPVEPERPVAHMVVRVGRRRPKPTLCGNHASNQQAGDRWMPRSRHCSGCGQAWCSSGNTFFGWPGRTTTSIGSMRPRIATVRRSS